MQPLSLDFVRRPFPVWPGVLFLMAGLGIAAAEWYGFQDARASRSEAEHRMQRMEHRATPVTQRKPTREMSARLKDEYRLARQVGEFLLLPWPNLFAALEAAAMPDIALLAVEPDSKKHEVRIVAEARSSETLFAYVKRLEGVPQLQDVHLLRHEVRDDDKQHPLRFTVSASWKELP